MKTPEEVDKIMSRLLLNYTEMYGHWERSREEPCLCSKVIQGKCVRCERLRSLTERMEMLLRSLILR